MTSTVLTDRIVRDLHRLCDAGDRHLGTDRNREATTFVAARMRELGVDVEGLPFEVPE